MGCTDSSPVEPIPSSAPTPQRSAAALSLAPGPALVPLTHAPAVLNPVSPPGTARSSGDPMVMAERLLAQDNAAWRRDLAALPATPLKPELSSRQSSRLPPFDNASFAATTPTEPAFPPAKRGGLTGSIPVRVKNPVPDKDSVAADNTDGTFVFDNSKFRHANAQPARSFLDDPMGTISPATPLAMPNLLHKLSTHTQKWEPTSSGPARWERSGVITPPLSSREPPARAPAASPPLPLPSYPTSAGVQSTSLAFASAGPPLATPADPQRQVVRAPPPSSVLSSEDEDLMAAILDD